MQLENIEIDKLSDIFNLGHPRINFRTDLPVNQFHRM